MSDWILKLPFDVLKLEILNNTVADYLAALVIWLVCFLVLRVLRNFFSRRMDRVVEAHTTSVNAGLYDSFETALYTLVRFAAFHAAAATLNYGPHATSIVENVLFAILVCLVLVVAFRAATLLFDLYLRSRGGRLESHKARAILPVLKGVLWVITAVFLLDNFGFKITSILAGLGVAGVAVGLAAQAILGDLFSYFAILMDRPFQLGDFIIVGDYLGSVEHVGLKTSRLRSLDGEQIVMSNSDLTGSRVRNYGRMFRRRVLFRFGVVYQTPPDKLEAVPGMVREIVEAQGGASLDRAHFFRFGDSSLDYEVVYYVSSPDYNVYMDIQQAVCLGMIRRFAAEGIDFAYPTRTLFVSGSLDHPAADGPGDMVGSPAGERAGFTPIGSNAPETADA